MNEGRFGNSFRDPSGFVYRKNGIIYRQINHCYRSTWEHFIACGLYNDLVASGSLISHETAPDERGETDEAWLVIRPDPVAFWSYPYEWCFSQLKDAALLTLSIQKKALQYSMSMKDASAYNVQFVNGRPVLIDSLSFENYDPKRGWKGFRQFCMHFLAPLALMSRRDHRLGQLLRVYMDGIPLELASSLLPRKSWLSFSTLMHIHLHAKSEKWFSRKTDIAQSKYVMNLDKIQSLVGNLESAISRLDIRLSSKWVHYYSDIHYGQEAFLHKEKLVRAYIEMVSPEIVWDLGANEGFFSRIAAKQARLVVSFDSDMASVESNYRDCKNANCTNILPLWLDLTNPSSRLGLGNNETMNLGDRGPADLILCLALVHHFAITSNIPLNRIAEWMENLTKSLIIEFVPKSDPMVQRLLFHREDIFSHYDEESFESCFSKYFLIIKSGKVPGTSRTIYLMQSFVGST